MQWAFPFNYNELYSLNPIFIFVLSSLKTMWEWCNLYLKFHDNKRSSLRKESFHLIIWKSSSKKIHFNFIVTV